MGGTEGTRGFGLASFFYALQSPATILPIAFAAWKPLCLALRNTVDFASFIRQDLGWIAVSRGEDDASSLLPARGPAGAVVLYVGGSGGLISVDSGSSGSGGSSGSSGNCFSPDQGQIAHLLFALDLFGRVDRRTGRSRLGQAGDDRHVGRRPHGLRLLKAWARAAHSHLMSPA